MLTERRSPKVLSRLPPHSVRSPAWPLLQKHSPKVLAVPMARPSWTPCWKPAMRRTWTPQSRRRPEARDSPPQSPRRTAPWTSGLPLRVATEKAGPTLPPCPPEARSPGAIHRRPRRRVTTGRPRCLLQDRLRGASVRCGDERPLRRAHKLLLRRALVTRLRRMGSDGRRREHRGWRPPDGRRRLTRDGPPP